MGLEFRKTAQFVSQIPYHHRLCNYIHDHPFQLVMALEAPLASGILYHQVNLKGLTLSQRIMHSRVYAQGGILLILLTTMSFRTYMDKIGRFAEPF
jgi:hypothetical protein